MIFLLLEDFLEVLMIPIFTPASKARLLLIFLKNS